MLRPTGNNAARPDMAPLPKTDFPPMAVAYHIDLHYNSTIVLLQVTKNSYQNNLRIIQSYYMPIHLERGCDSHCLHNKHDSDGGGPAPSMILWGKAVRRSHAGPDVLVATQPEKAHVQALFPERPAHPSPCVFPDAGSAHMEKQRTVGVERGSEFPARFPPCAHHRHSHGHGCAPGHHISAAPSTPRPAPRGFPLFFHRKRP